MEFLKRLAERGWAPHGAQQSFLDNPSKFRVLACGRRWGKTDVAAADIAMRIALSEEGTQIAIAPTLAQVRIVFERVKWMLGAAGVVYSANVTPFPSIKVHEYGDKTRSALHLLDARSGHEMKNLRGYGADHVLIDEAAYVPETLITDVAMPMLAATSGRMTLMSTPRGKNHFYRFFKMGQSGENGFWSRTSPSWENPLVDEWYLDIQRRIVSDRTFRTEYGAEFLEHAGAVFPVDLLDKAMTMEPVDSGSVVVGVDWARCSDYTVAIAVRGTKEHAEVVSVFRLQDPSWRSIVRRVAAFARRSGASLVVSDATGVGDSTTQMLMEHLHDTAVRDVRFTQQNKSEMVEDLKWMFEQKRLRLPSEPVLLKELENFEGEEREFGIRYSAPAGGHDDCVVALMLAAAGLEVGEPPMLRGR